MAKATLNDKTGITTVEFSPREMETLRRRFQATGMNSGKTATGIRQALEATPIFVPVADLPKIRLESATIAELREGDIFIHMSESFKIASVDDSHCETGSVVLFDKDGNATEYELTTNVLKLV